MFVLIGVFLLCEWLLLGSFKKPTGGAPVGRFASVVVARSVSAGLLSEFADQYMEHSQRVAVEFANKIDDLGSDLVGGKARISPLRILDRVFDGGTQVADSATPIAAPVRRTWQPALTTKSLSLRL
jgi:hypothetical protein